MLFNDANKDKIGIGFSSVSGNDLSSSLHISGDLTVNSHITASGNISSSGGNITLGKLKVVGNETTLEGTHFHLKTTATQVDNYIGGASGNTTSYIQFGLSNKLQLFAKSEQMIEMDGNADIITFGDGGDIAYKFRTLNDDNTLYISGSSDKVGIGTDTPGEKLEVIGNISASGIVKANQVQVNGTSVIETLVASDTQGRLTKTAGATASPIQLTNLGTTGNPTFNHITASGEISASGTIYGKQIHYQHHAYLEDSDHGENFIPMAGTLAEVSTAQYYSKKIAPYDGEILKVLINCENDPGDTSVIFYKNGTKEAKETILDGSIGTDTAIFQTLNTYPLVGIGTADRTFSQGDILSISINPANAPGEVQVTTVWSYTVGP